MVMSTDLFYCYNTVVLQYLSTWSENYCQIDVRYGYGIYKKDSGILLIAAACYDFDHPGYSNT